MRKLEIDAHVSVTTLSDSSVIVGGVARLDGVVQRKGIYVGRVYACAAYELPIMMELYCEN